jgi:hypothetical protein
VVTFSSEQAERDDSKVRACSGTVGVLDTTIKTLVDIGPASVRLRNSIQRAANEGNIPLESVGEYLAAGSTARTLFMRYVYAFGLRTADELDKLVNTYIERCGVDPHKIGLPAASAVFIDPRADRLADLARLLDGLTYGDAIHGQMPSVRLQNGLSAPGLMEAPIVALFIDSITARNELLNTPNFGRKSLAELEEFAQAAAIRTLARHCTDPAQLVDDCALLFGMADPQKQELAQKILKILTDGPPCEDDFQRLIDWAMPELRAREIKILGRRYGFDAAESETLEEIGASLDVTRERIRQIEAKALRKLRSKLAGTGFFQAVEIAADNFWRERTPPYLLIGEMADVRKALPAKFCLALDIADLNPAGWIAQGSVELRNGYAAPHFDCAAIRSIAAQLDAIDATRPLPVALADLFPDHDPDMVAAAAALETELCVFEGYLFRNKPGVRLKRTVRLHHILGVARRSMTLYELGEAYACHRRTDDCSLRDIAIVMEDAPHLFVEIEDGLIWRSVGADRVPAHPTPITSQNEATDGTVTLVDPDTIAGCLQKALIARGPTSVGELYREGQEILVEGRSRGSIPFVLGGRPDLFRRILPGVYALPGQMPAQADVLDGAPLPFFLNEAQARPYAFARKAGEAWGTYAFWTPTAEYRLCSWARFDADPALYHSLLAIASIDEWPVSDSERAEWRRRAALHARFEIVLHNRELLVEARPELDRLLAACFVSAERGAINWLTINRIMSRRLDAAGGQALLALLVGLNCIDPPADAGADGVLLSHRATPRAAALAAELSEQLLHEGELRWESPLGERLVIEAFQRAPSEMGWVPQDRLEALFDADHLPGSNFVVLGEDDSEDDLIARLMRDHRREADLARRNALAAGLLDD